MAAILQKKIAVPVLPKKRHSNAMKVLTAKNAPLTKPANAAKYLASAQLIKIVVINRPE